MKNSVVASIEFCFKGETFSPSVCVDLDIFFRSGRTVESLYAHLGKSIGLDEYRHEYDVMENEDICFSEATGIVVDYIHDGAVDWQALEKAWWKQGALNVLIPIANKFFNVENLDTDPKLAAALLAAYQSGVEKGQQTNKINHGLNEGFYG